MDFIDKFIATMCGFVIVGIIWLLADLIPKEQQQREHYKQVCTEQKGTAVYNGRNLECLK